MNITDLSEKEYNNHYIVKALKRGERIHYCFKSHKGERTLSDFHDLDETAKLPNGQLNFSEYSFHILIEENRGFVELFVKPPIHLNSKGDVILSIKRSMIDANRLDWIMTVIIYAVQEFQMKFPKQNIYAIRIDGQYLEMMNFSNELKKIKKLE